MTEETLSDKIEKFDDGRDYGRRTEEGLVLVKDVKNFIKELKERIQIRCSGINQCKIYYEIDKLAGDDLR